MPQYRITEIKNIKIHQGCIDRPVYFWWMGLDGTPQYWLFGKTQFITDKVGAGSIIERNIEDLEDADTVMDFLTKNHVRKMTCGAENILLEDLEGIRGILYAVKVQILMNPLTWQTEGITWQTVLVNQGSFKTEETEQNRHEVEFTVDFPPTNIQQQ